MYNFSEENTLEVAEPSMTYSTSYNKNMSEEGTESTIQYFQKQLNNLQEVIMDMRNKLSSLPTLKTEKSLENILSIALIISLHQKIPPLFYYHYIIV